MRLSLESRFTFFIHLCCAIIMAKKNPSKKRKNKQTLDPRLDPIKIIKGDHEQVKTLFSKFKDSEKSKRSEIAEKIFAELDIHARIEEEIFYPAIESVNGEREKEMVKESLAEHKQVKDLMSELQALGTEHDDFEAKFKVLRENVEHHAEEEEKNMLPDAQKKLKSDLGRLGQEMLDRKKELLESTEL